MKKFFGEYNFRVRRFARREGMDIKSFLREASRQCDRNDEIAGAQIAMLEIEGAVLLNGDGIHYFVETEALADWLPTTVRGYDLHLLKELRESEYGVIHTTGKKATGVLFAFGEFSGLQFMAADNENISIARPDYIVRTPTLDLVFGLCLYIKCFPHAVRYGFPDCAKHPAHYKGERCALVSAVPEVEERNGPTPHFRTGHFRCYVDDRYTKMRGQVQWIEDTFVKGRAKTVEEVEEAFA